MIGALILVPFDRRVCPVDSLSTNRRVGFVEHGDASIFMMSVAVAERLSRVLRCRAGCSHNSCRSASLQRGRLNWRN